MHNPFPRFVRVNDKEKMDETSKFGESWVYEKMGKKWKNVEMGVMGRPAVAMGGGVMVRWRMGGGFW
jgi:hypothetical protein